MTWTNPRWNKKDTVKTLLMPCTSAWSKWCNKRHIFQPKQYRYCAILFGNRFVAITKCNLFIERNGCLRIHHLMWCNCVVHANNTAFIDALASQMSSPTLQREVTFIVRCFDEDVRTVRKKYVVTTLWYRIRQRMAEWKMCIWWMQTTLTTLTTAVHAVKWNDWVQLFSTFTFKTAASQDIGSKWTPRSPKAHILFHPLSIFHWNLLFRLLKLFCRGTSVRSSSGKFFFVKLELVYYDLWSYLFRLAIFSVFKFSISYFKVLLIT